MMNILPIETAPKDGTVIYIFNRDVGIGFAMAWNTKRQQWEGLAFTLMKAVKVYWDKQDDVQPTHWRKC